MPALSVLSVLSNTTTLTAIREVSNAGTVRATVTGSFIGMLPERVIVLATL
jgi:hypothetical protein